MGLYLRGKTYWYKIHTENGRIQVSTKTANKRLAQKFYAKAMTDVIEGRLVKNSR